MATATTQVVYDYSATGPSRDAAAQKILTLLKPYKDAGIITNIPDWSPSNPGTTVPTPTSGLFTATRLWQDATAAQTFISDWNAWFASNPTSYINQNFTIVP